MLRINSQHLIVLVISVILAGCSVEKSISSNVGQGVNDIQFERANVIDLCLSTVGDKSELELDIELDFEITKLQARASDSDPNSWVLIGNAWIEKYKQTGDPGFYSHAEGCAQKAISLDNKYTLASELQLKVLLNSHKFKETVQLANTVLLDKPDSSFSWAALSDAQLELGNIDLAEDALNEMQLYSSGIAFYTRVSYLLWLRGDVAMAEKILLLALKESSDRKPYSAAWSFAQSADMAWARGDLKGADALYKKSQEYVSNYPIAILGLARVYIAQNKGESALSLLDELEITNPSAELTWLKLSAHKILNHTAAIVELERSVVQQARLNDPLLLSRLLLSENKDIALALTLIEAEMVSRGGIYIEDTYAWALYRSNKLNEANLAIDKALSWGTQDAKLFFHAGAIKFANGEEGKGIQLIEQALALNPNFDFTETIEARNMLTAYSLNRSPRNTF